MTLRTDRLGSTLHRAIQQVLARGLADPRIKGLITVTAVHITPDLKRADVLITVMPEEHEALTLHGLRAAAGHIRRVAGELVRIKIMPHLEFAVDEGLKRQAGVLDALRRVEAEREQSGDESRS